MGLLDTWSRRAMERREGRIDFLGEQSGLVESTLKRALILEFATRPAIRRAYLATVAFEPQATPAAPAATAVCIVSSDPDDRSLVVRIGDIVRRNVADDSTFDVVFLTAEQERELEKVCRPFYSSPI
jgi:hypothetical protein